MVSQEKQIRWTTLEFHFSDTRRRRREDYEFEEPKVSRLKEYDYPEVPLDPLTERMRDILLETKS